jgi:acyltransferase
MPRTAESAGRSPAIDAVRVLGMLAIVAGHVWWGETARAALYTWHVPLFFAVSGYLWTPGRSLKHELRSRTLTLLMPYALWFLVIAAVTWTVQVLGDTFSLGRAVTSVYGGSFTTAPFSAFWFVTALFFACLAYRLMDRMPLWGKWLLAILALFLTAYVPEQPATLLPLGAGLGLAALIFLTTGETLRRGLDQMSQWTQVAAGSLAVALGVLLVLSGLASPLDIKFLDFGSPIVSVVAAILLSSGAIALSCALLNQVSAKVAAAITLTAQASLVVLFVHIPMLLLAGGAGTENVWSFTWAVLASWAIGLALLKTPRSWPLTGIRTKAKAVIAHAPSSTTHR